MSFSYQLAVGKDQKYALLIKFESSTAVTERYFFELDRIGRNGYDAIITLITEECSFSVQTIPGEENLALHYGPNEISFSIREGVLGNKLIMSIQKNPETKQFLISMFKKVNDTVNREPTFEELANRCCDISEKSRRILQGKS